MRKLFHIGGGSFLLGLYLLLGRGNAIPVFAVLFFSVLGFDLARIRSPRFNRWILRHFGSILRDEERDGFTAMPYFTSGAFLASLLYSPPVAKASLILLTFGDVSATMVGQNFGRIRIGRKSLEGSAAFVLAGALAAILLSPLHDLPLATIAIGALSGALIELVSTRVNDNLTIPVVTGGVMTLMG